MPERTISIALATYDGEKYIREQLDSILAQTVTDWELVAVDDCSTDGTIGILREYAARDGRIRIYANESNLGFRRNFEKAISLCCGGYVALSDQDDIWLPDHLELLMRTIGGRSLACGNALVVSGENRDIGPLNEFEHLRLLPSPSQKILYTILLYRNCFQGASMLMTREFAEGCLPVPDGIPYHDAWLAANACMQDGLAYSFDIITRYRQHGDNVTARMKAGWKRGTLSKLLEGLGGLAGIHHIQTDRFRYCDVLKERYGLGNPDFRNIYRFLRHLEDRRVRPSDLRMLWDNFHSICTEKSRKSFLKFCVVWYMWRRQEQDGPRPSGK